MQHITAAHLPNPLNDVDDTSKIPGWQRRLHFYSELTALLLLPKLFDAARDARPPHKKFLTALAWGTLLVDGYLVYRWATDDSIKSPKQKVKLAVQSSKIGPPPPPAGAGAPLAGWRR